MCIFVSVCLGIHMENKTSVTCSFQLELGDVNICLSCEINFNHQTVSFKFLFQFDHSLVQNNVKVKCCYIGLWALFSWITGTWHKPQLSHNRCPHGIVTNRHSGVQKLVPESCKCIFCAHTLKCQKCTFKLWYNALESKETAQTFIASYIIFLSHDLLVR